MSARRTSFYLDKQNARIMGVAAGTADYFGWDRLLVRVGFVLLTIFLMGPVLPIIYLIVGWVADAKPRALYGDSPDEAQFWAKVRRAPQHSIRDVRSTFRDADRRLRDLETYVTSSNSRLSAEIDRLR